MWKCFFKLIWRYTETTKLQVYLDNWFYTLPLLLKMKSFGILTTATIRANRLGSCLLKAEKDVKNEGCGSSSFRADINSGIMLLRWFVNKSVQLASTFSSAVVSGAVKTILAIDSPKCFFYEQLHFWVQARVAKGFPCFQHNISIAIFFMNTPYIQVWV